MAKISFTAAEKVEIIRALVHVGNIVDGWYKQGDEADRLIIIAKMATALGYSIEDVGTYTKLILPSNGDAEATLTDLPLKFVDDIEVVEDYVVVYNSPYPADLAATYRAALHEALANHAPLPRCRCAMIDEGESNG